MIVWLGFLWNLQEGKIEVPPEKFLSVQSVLRDILHNIGHVTARKVASFVGKIISLKPALGTVCQMMTRNLSVALCNRKGWDLNLDLPSECRQELEFWLKSLHSLPNVKLTPISEIPEKIMFSDASSYAAAGFTLERNTKIVHYMWKDDEKNKSSTWRELKTICLVLKGLGSDLSGKLVKIYTDNQNVVRIACKGSMKMELHQLALEVLGFCVAHSIRLELAWIPRDLNAYADELSKIFDFDDWEVRDEIFTFLNKKWGEFSCDIFADCKNKKVSKFFSKYYSPGTSGVDAFAQNWDGENCWLVPPPNLICRTVSHLRICKAFGVLIVPRWESALFWPIIWERKYKNFRYFVRDWIEFERPKNFYKAGSDKNSIFALDVFPSNVLVLKLDFCYD
ncbi:hypothetical protein FSP39_009337 [Pinctada imbricata]|uniref:RNase H type-1 domain-containing protein n=1 Tax=Pinctada imbricata TaxID=66713 RepID=A0AA88XQZ7_PINIB|nr:hypothetical protein FSP39_009337 [Pinctada imbricata]